MNKKLQSIVLALVLSFSLGLGSVSNVFANAYSDYANEFNAYYAGKTENNSVTVKVGAPDDLLQGNLSQVFGYYAGSLISAMAAGNTYTLYDSFGPRATVTNVGEIWSVTGWDARTADLAEISKFGTAEGYLMSVGFTAEQVSIMDMDKDGNILDKEGNPIKMSDDGTFASEVGKSAISGEWFSELKETLSKGANFSANISLGTGATGPSLTVSQNGKPQIVYQTDATTGGMRPTSLYIYDSKGFMIGQQTAAFEINKTEDGTAQGKWTFNYTSITYDSNGKRTDRDYQFFNWADNPQSALAGAAVATPDKNEIDENTKVLQTSTTEYSNNNSKVKQINHTTNDTTYFANNKQSHVMNNEGTIVGQYDYTANYVLASYFNANGTDSKGNKVGTTTVFDKWGRSLFTSVTGSANDVMNNETNRNNLIAEYNAGVASGQFSENTTITNFSVYAEDLLVNPPRTVNGFIDMKNVTSRHYNTALNKLGYANSDIKNMLAFANGFGAVAQTSIASSDWGEKRPDNAREADNIAKTTVEKTDDTTRQNSSSTTYKGIAYTNTIILGGSNAYSTVCNVITSQQTVNTTGTAPAPSSDPAVEGDLFPAVSDEELEAAGIDPNDAEAVAAFKKAKVDELAAELGIAEGTQAYEDLANGFYTDENGDTFAIVNMNEINLIDGNGFQSAAGELMFVEVSEAAKTEIINKVGDTGDTGIMFFGDVREGVDGFMAMTMNESYVADDNAGFVVGGTEIDNVKAEIAAISQAVAAQRTGTVTAEQQALIDNAEANGYAWVVNNTNDNMDTFGQGNFSWDENKTARENIEAAWTLLMNF